MTDLFKTGIFMNYGEIKYCDIANGSGVRISVFVSGCTHHCPGCFNPKTWDFNYGKPFTEQTWEEIFSGTKDYIKGLSLLGGEPCEPDNQRALTPFLREYKKRFPDKDVWCYTGYTFEQMSENGIARIECTDEFLSYIDYLVDGPFINAKKNIGLVFRGSSNQRIIDIKKTRESGTVVQWEGIKNDK